jgi:hypothetical protein
MALDLTCDSAMNLTFLGDALDHWKGSLFESMQKAEVLKNFAVDPMASDLPAWNEQDFDLFARLLRVRRSQVVPHQHSLVNRASYFKEITHSGDLFLDPDTGIATGKRPTEKHIAPGEIRSLIDASDRVVAVYQHVRAQRVCDRVDAVCGALRDHIPECHWCSYESGTVAMLFVSRNHKRLAAVSRHFSAVLGRHAAGRIRGSTCR